jgi:SAM-dependent methyltransferase
MHLFVAGLSDDTTEEELRELFSRIGTVKSAMIIRDAYSGKPKGFGGVEMSSSTEGEEAIRELSGAMLGGRQISVSKGPEMLPGELEFRTWLTENAFDVLEKVGVRKGQAVLDYGCGSGTFAIPSAKIVGEEGKVYALEVHPQDLECVSEKAKDEGLGNIETVLSDSPRLTTGLPDGSVDAVLVYDVMHVIDDRQGLLKELHRVLRPDGFLSIFPMHIGTDKMLEIVNECGLFCLRERYRPPEYKTASEVLNFNKYQSK